MSYEKKTTYFDKAGKQNTETLLKLVKEYLKDKDIKNIVVASTTGETGEKASRIIKVHNLIVVTHHFGFREQDRTELKEEHKRGILENGAKIFTGTHALSGVERAIRKDFGTLQPLELISNTLRIIGEGTKVCVEIVLMAADAGLIPFGQDLVALAGTGKGVDTALRIQSANSSNFFKLKIREVIAKPADF